MMQEVDDASCFVSNKKIMISPRKYHARVIFKLNEDFLVEGLFNTATDSIQYDRILHAI